MDANCKRYCQEFGISIAAYALMVPISIWLLKTHGESRLRVVYAALPVIPSIFMVWAGVRYFRGLDELQRRIQLEAIAFSFFGTCLFFLTWGFLQNAGLPHADVIWVAPLLIMLWGVGNAIASRRYR